MANIDNRIIIIGGGGHAGVVIEAIISAKKYTILGVLDDTKNNTDTCHGYPVLGKLSEAEIISTRLNCKNFHIAVGSPKARKVIWQSLPMGLNYPNVIHAKSYVSITADIGNGNFFAANSFVGANTMVVNHCIINTNSSIDHDNEIMSFCNINPNSATGGNVKIGKLTEIGMGVNIRNAVTIGENCFIQMGCVVTKDILDNSTVKIAK